MLRKWGLRGLILLGAAFGAFLIIAFTLQIPAVGKTIGSPQACGTCHVMDYEVTTLAKSAHRDLACLDCHGAQGFVEKPVEEVKSASRHLFIFMTNATPDVIKPQHESLEIIQSNCAQCHAQRIEQVHVGNAETGKFCFDCHRNVPHGRPLRN